MTDHSTGAEGTIVARVVPSIDHSHSWIVLLVAAAVLVISFTVLWLLLRSKHKKGIAMIFMS